MKVGFLVVGAQKCGTSALAEFLSVHPQICMAEFRTPHSKLCAAESKEVHFFDIGASSPDRPATYEEYHRLFPEKPGATVFGEATPSYMYWDSAAERIYRYNPKMKLIFILRNPVERAYSHYVMQHKRGKEKLPLWLALRAEKIRALKTFPKRDLAYSYVDRGFYSKQIKHLLCYFERKQMLFLKTDELRDFHDSTLNRVYDFLEVDRVENPETRMVFSNQYTEMSPFQKNFLQRKFKMEFRDLEKLLDWDCSSWYR